jgi:nucleoside-diphosphate-sugar epimerase
MTASPSLITGGSGYFGSLLRDRLVARGQPVRVLDLADTADRPPAVEFIAGDIRDRARVAEACSGCDTVYHCVAQVPLAKDRKLFHTVNVGGTALLLDAARAASVRKIIYLSSSAVYGAPMANPVNEATPPMPGEAYGRAKLEGEALCRLAATQGADVTIIRPRTIMGHGRLGIFQILFEWIRTGYNVPVFGDGANIYQFVHADDLADACMLAASRPGASVYVCGTDRFGTMRSVLERLCAHARTGSEVRGVPMAPAVWAMHVAGALGLSPLGPYHALMYGRSLYFDISKARTELGWKPRFSNDDMFVQSYEWYLQNREVASLTDRASRHRSAVRQGILGCLKFLL